MKATLLFTLQIDCEATQRSIRDPALGKRSILGLGELLATTGTRGTFLVIPSDIEAHAALYKELEAAGHEIGLHVHPADQGFEEFLGVHSADDQRTILSEGIDRFAQALGRRPASFCPGYFSANDFTFGVLEELGFTHGAVSCPTRNLPQCAAVWAGSPLDPHYPHRHNRLLAGDVNFVELPVTVDPESRLWGGGQPLDLRVELVDAKNHWYTINKAVRRQLDEKTPLKQIHALTHNTFDYNAPGNFRRETYVGMVQAARQIAEREKLRFQPATLAEVAAAFRQAVPFHTAQTQELKLDTRGRNAPTPPRPNHP
ncbi:MAG: polysaccharide deacetylase family protein [Verrucomicrobiae bacterium]|nr:polysaccharide deacetylase family protein [Verrucomicrobiae bacterium]